MQLGLSITRISSAARLEEVQGSHLSSKIEFPDFSLTFPDFYNEIPGIRLIVKMVRFEKNFIVGSSTPTPTPCLLHFFFKFFIFTTIIATVNRFLSIEIPTLLCNMNLYFFYFAFFYLSRVFSSFLLFSWLHPKFPDFSLTTQIPWLSLTLPDFPGCGNPEVAIEHRLGDNELTSCRC